MEIAKLKVYSSAWDFLYLCNAKMAAVLTDKNQT